MVYQILDSGLGRGAPNTDAGLEGGILQILNDETRCAVMHNLWDLFDSFNSFSGFIGMVYAHIWHDPYWHAKLSSITYLYMYIYRVIGRSRDSVTKVGYE